MVWKLIVQVWIWEFFLSQGVVGGFVFWYICFWFQFLEFLVFSFGRGICYLGVVRVIVFRRLSSLSWVYEQLYRQGVRGVSLGFFCCSCEFVLGLGLKGFSELFILQVFIFGWFYIFGDSKFGSRVVVFFVFTLYFLGTFFFLLIFVLGEF